MLQRWFGGDRKFELSRLPTNKVSTLISIIEEHFDRGYVLIKGTSTSLDQTKSAYFFGILGGDSRYTIAKDQYCAKRQQLFEILTLEALVKLF